MLLMLMFIDAVANVLLLPMLLLMLLLVLLWLLFSLLQSVANLLPCVETDGTKKFRDN